MLGRVIILGMVGSLWITPVGTASASSSSTHPVKAHSGRTLKSQKTSSSNKTKTASKTKATHTSSKSIQKSTFDSHPRPPSIPAEKVPPPPASVPAKPVVVLESLPPPLSKPVSDSYTLSDLGIRRSVDREWDVSPTLLRDPYHPPYVNAPDTAYTAAPAVQFERKF